MRIVIDPYMIAIPTGKVDRTSILEYVQRLKKWEHEFSDTKKYIVSDLALDVIYSLGLSPTISNLRELFIKF